MDVTQRLGIGVEGSLDVEAQRTDCVPNESDSARCRAIAERDPGQQSHSELCPLGRGATRWFSCGRHNRVVVFPAGLGKMDFVANSCPLCSSLCSSYIGCVCPHSVDMLDRSSRPGRPIRIRGVDARSAGQVTI
jgi:hypothetical protein